MIDEPAPPPGFVPFTPPAAQAAPAATAEPPPPPGFVPYNGEPDADFDTRRSVTQGATGFNEGFGASVLRPLDVIPYLASKAMGGEGVHPFEGTFREHFVDPMGTPQNRIEENLRAGGRMVGENLPLMATGAAAAPMRSGVTLAEQGAQLLNNERAPLVLGAKSVGEGVSAVANKVRGAADSVLAGMEANPVASAVAENAGAGAAGFVGNVGRNISKDSGGTEQEQQTAELAGQLVAGPGAALYGKLAPTKLAAKATVAVGKKVLENVPPDIVPENWRPTGGSFAERQAEKSAYANREGKYADPNVAPPPEPDFATRRMDAGQAAREDKAAGAAGKEFNQILAQPDAAANLAESQRLETTIPGFKPGVAKATQDPALLKLQDSMESRATGDELRGVQQAHDANVGAIREYKDNIVPAAGENPQDAVAAANAGRVKGINDKLDTAADTVRGKITGVSDSLPEVDPTVTGNVLRDTRKSLKAEADAKVGELRKNVDPDGTGVVSIEGREPMSVNDALNRRAQINQDLADHYNSNNRDFAATQSIRKLQEEKEALDSAIGQVNAPGLKEYNDYYRDEYAPRFLQGASRDIGRFARNGYEGNRVAAEDVPTKMLGPNSISEARQVNKLYGDNPEVKQQIIDHHLDDLRRTAIDPNTGQLREGAVNKYLAKNERLFNEMPWVREAIAAKNPDDLYARLGQLEQRQRAVADTKAASLLGKNPEQHIDAALNDWQVMKGLRNSVRGDSQAEAALRRAVIDRAPDPMNVEKFKTWLDGNDRSLRQVLDPDHIKALKDVLGAATITNQLPRPKGTVDLPGSLADKGAQKFGISVPSLLQRFLSVKQGRMSAEYGIADVSMRALRQFSNKEIENAWKEALYNPKVAKDLQLMVKGGGATPIQLARMRNYLLSIGLHDSEEPK